MIIHRNSLLFFILGLGLVLKGYSQNSQRFRGRVTDSLNHPLQAVNVIAKPLSAKASLQFAITNKEGYFKLSLQKSMGYKISVDYLGYKKQSITLQVRDTLSFFHFKLRKSSTQLREIVITDDYHPVQIKKDTIVYDVSAFTAGNERKMREAIEKLPGVKVSDEGQITVNGKKITKMLVEGRSFFGGSSKLAVDNIPADALDKIQIISNYSPVGFLKNVTNSGQTVMNVKLKADRKKFLFGNIEVGGGNHQSYRFHPALFYYSPNIEMGYIGDLNNVGKSVMSYADIIRLKGGVNRIINNKHIDLSALRNFSDSHKNVLRNKTQFSAVNFGFVANDKLYVSGVGLFSKLYVWNKNREAINYLTNENPTFEERLNNSSDKNLSLWFNLTLDYDKSATEKWYYNTQIEVGRRHFFNGLQSITNQTSTLFDTQNKKKNFSLNQYLEWDKSYNENHKSTLAFKYVHTNKTPRASWASDKPFLTDFLPLTPQNIYQIQQVQHLKADIVNGVFKFYWILNATNQLHFSIGNRFKNLKYQLRDYQKMDDESVTDIALSGFSNDMNYKFNDAYFRTDYKFMIGKLRNTASLVFHLYHLKTSQFSGVNELSRFYVEPIFESKYEFNNNTEIELNYRLTNDFPTMNLVNESFVLKSFNSLFKGNALLKNKRYHSLSLTFNKFGLSKGWMFFGMVNFFKEVKSIQNRTVFDGIKHFSRPFLTDNATQNLSFTGRVSKNIHRFRLGANVSLDKYDYQQEINGVSSINHNNHQAFGISLRTVYKKWPNIRLGYNKSFNQFKGLSETKFQCDTYKARIKYRFLPSWNFKANYQYVGEKNIGQGVTNDYQVIGASVDFKKKNSPWGINLSVTNLLNTKMRHNQSIASYQTIETGYFVLPRIFLLSIRYKL